MYFLVRNITDQDIQQTIDATQLETHEKDIRAQHVIMDAMKDDLLPHLAKKKTTREMFKGLVDLFQSGNMNRKIILRNKLKSI